MQLLDDAEPEVTTRIGAGLRKPNTGTLQIRIIGVKQQNNAPTRTLKPPETLCMIKVDGVPRSKTRPARSGTQGARWNEDFDIPVEKASEVELTLYDKPDNHLIPIGSLWVKISDITDELRRKKVELESGPGWAPAGVAGQVVGPENNQYEGRPGGAALGANLNNGQAVTVDGIECWFDLEPVGQICIKFNFGMLLMFLLATLVVLSSKAYRLILSHFHANHSQGHCWSQEIPFASWSCWSCS